jgi:hypothetical protein
MVRSGGRIEVTLELSQLTAQVQAIGDEVARRRNQQVDLLKLARDWLAQYADQGEAWRRAAQAVRTAIPTTEPWNYQGQLPPLPERFTVIAADGSQIHPDPHSAALYYVINVGGLVYRHGSGDAPAAHSRPTFGYTDEDLYEGGLPVAGNLLDVRRDLAEVTLLAELCADEPTRPLVALVDGTLILWVLENLPAEGRQAKVTAYLEQLSRLRRAGAAVAAFVSRPRRTEVTRLLYLADLEGDTNRFQQTPNPLERLPDRVLFGNLPPGARSALFISPSEINHRYYAPEGQEIRFFYLNLSAEPQEPIIARIEIPVWVAEDADLLAAIHGAVVSQARITGDYPYALARADELAFISGPERRAFEEMVTTALVRAGVRPTLSPKAYQKSLTRRGRRKYL